MALFALVVELEVVKNSAVGDSRTHDESKVYILETLGEELICSTSMWEQFFSSWNLHLSDSLQMSAEVGKATSQFPIL